MSARAVWSAVGVAACVCALGGAASGDPAAAAATAKEAEKAGKAGDYPGAAAKFRAAYDLDPRPQYLCNVGVAYYNAKDLPRAQLYLADCLAKGSALDAKLVEQLRGALTGVEGELRGGAYAALDVAVSPPEATFTVDSLGPHDAITGSHLVWVPVGTRTITGSAPAGHWATKTVSIDAKPGGRTVAIELAQMQRDVEVVRPRATVAAPRSKAPAVVTSAFALAAGGGALYAWLHARSIMDGASSTTITMDQYDHIVSRGHKWQHASWGLAGGAVVLGGVSGWLWYRATRSESTTVEVHPGDGGASVLVGGRF